MRPELLSYRFRHILCMIRIAIAYGCNRTRLGDPNLVVDTLNSGRLIVIFANGFESESTSLALQGDAQWPRLGNRLKIVQTGGLTLSPFRIFSKRKYTSHQFPPAICLSSPGELWTWAPPFLLLPSIQCAVTLSDGLPDESIL
jgi:hypothetical protein